MTTHLLARSLFVQLVGVHLGRLPLCLGRHLHMPVSLCLPEHMQVVANEEMALLQKLRSLTPHHRQHPSLTLLTRNEIFRMARELLDGESWRSFCEFAFQLSQRSGHDGIIAFPLPCLRAVDAVTDAEALAESFLQEGSGSLWSAVREVVRCLPLKMMAARWQMDGCFVSDCTAKEDSWVSLKPHGHMWQLGD